MLNDVVNLAQAEPWFWLLTVALVSLCVGSFLNVVIYRIPEMMKREWQGECRVLLADELKKPTQKEALKPFNLITPKSRCPKCDASIKPWHNIPVLGWLMLKGRCASCDAPISPRYPLIEAFTAIMSLVVAHHFGATGYALAILLVTWALIALSFIDIDHMLLPDNITQPLLWFALLLSVFGLTISTTEALIGAAVGYLSLWSVFWLFKLVTGKEGMGYGDFKLLAVFGALLGWQSLLMIILLSSLVGAVLGITLMTIQGKDKAQPIPFGPYIAIAGWIAILWGTPIKAAYYNWMGL